VLLDIFLMTLMLAALSIPLAVTAWAFLDAARRPRWAWAFAGRNQLVWMVVIAAGILTVIGGLAISGWYLLRIRPQLAAIENGDIGTLDP
jgi:hypothetical protein